MEEVGGVLLGKWILGNQHPSSDISNIGYEVGITGPTVTV